jgi:signal transduction histidine kinase
MKNVQRVLPSDDSERLRRIRIPFPLGLKALLVVIVTLAPLVGAYLFIAYPSHYWRLADIAARVASEQVFLYGYHIRVYHLFLAGAGIIGALLGYATLGHFFIKPIRFLRTWMQQARSSDFEKVPVLPALRHDDIGEISRLLSSSVAHFSQTKQQNGILMEEKTLFMTIAAHQLRTPLTGLLWSIDALLSPDTPADSRQNLMTDIDGMLKRMRLIVNHILASANVEGGRFGYVFEKISVVPVIEKLLEEFKPVSDSHGVSLAFEHGDALFPVYADSERISLALFDLISNAIDYTPRGGTITVSVAPKGEELEISVADTGIGISEAEIPSLFTKFYRSDRARHMRPDGSGLGLFLVKNIIESHGSEIVVTSKEGSGSRFAFTLDSKKPD